MSGDRYKVLDGSESGHCCFEATVVDTTKLLSDLMQNGHPYEGSDGEPKCESVCECFDRDDAEQICAALNRT
ncbi:MAG: hypothetical protein GY794_16160 [bacterium]|nr:hypothetical protein [bacterium]